MINVKSFEKKLLTDIVKDDNMIKSLRCDRVNGL